MWRSGKGWSWLCVVAKGLTGPFSPILLYLSVEAHCSEVLCSKGEVKK